MTSETQTLYGLGRRRQGRSRPSIRYHSRSLAASDEDIARILSAAVSHRRTRREIPARVEWKGSSLCRRMSMTLSVAVVLGTVRTDRVGPRVARYMVRALEQRQ